MSCLGKEVYVARSGFLSAPKYCCDKGDVVKL